MTDFFDSLYYSIKDKNRFLSKIYFYNLSRLVVRSLANIIIPIYYSITFTNKKTTLATEISSSERVIVSLTSFPARIDRLWLVIESLLRQTYKPNKIILWLATSQFPNVDALPKKLLFLANRGLEIIFTDEDLKSHKKYYYAFEKFPNDIIITVDDDVFYNSHIIEYLIHSHTNYPDCICCNHASKITFKDKNLMPYLQWQSLEKASGPANNIFPIGVGGILYPPKILHGEVLNKKVFMENCKTADDVWLNAMTHLNDKFVVKTNYNSYYLPVLHRRNSELNTINNICNHNDDQIKTVRSHYINQLGIDPFNK
jgi:hypothetical protein